MDANQSSTTTAPQPFRRWTCGFTVVALAVSGIAVAVGWNFQQVYVPRPVSHAHGLIGHECRHCHVTDSAGRLLDSSVTEAACLHCHDGPIHKSVQISKDVPRCTECHSEHKGRSALSQVQDRFCVRCHGDLHTVNGPANAHRRHIKDFATHPEFAVLANKDPDKAVIRFNHAVHLKPDGVLGADGKPVRLECTTCHQPDEERRYMKPINYEAHCASCHAGQLVFDNEMLPNRPAPHREPETVLGVVRERYTQFIQQHPKVLDQDPSNPPARPIPGRPMRQPMSEAQWSWVSARLQKADHALFQAAGGCRYCHQVDAKNDTWQVAATNIPKRWLSNSTFRHDSHRLVRCTECHDARTSVLTRDVLLPSAASCKNCHHPSGGAQSTCVACHLYHDHAKERSFDGPLPLDVRKWQPFGAVESGKAP